VKLWLRVWCLVFLTHGVVELLERSAVELLTTFRKLEAGEFGSVATKLLLAYECYLSIVL